MINEAFSFNIPIPQASVKLNEETLFLINNVGCLTCNIFVNYLELDETLVRTLVFQLPLHNRPAKSLQNQTEGKLTIFHNIFIPS